MVYSIKKVFKPFLLDFLPSRVNSATLFQEFNYHDQNIRQTLAHDIQIHWTAVSILLDFIIRVHGDLFDWRSNKRPQIAQSINLNVSCKLHPYSLQGTWLPPRPRLPKRIKGERVLCKEYKCNLQDTFKLIGHAIAMTS